MDTTDTRRKSKEEPSSPTSRAGDRATRRVRGTVLWFDVRGTWPTPFGSMEIGRDACVLVSRFGFRRTIRRQDVIRVDSWSFDRWFGPKDTLYFVGVDGRLIRPAFKPMSPGKADDRLREFGWPVEEVWPNRREYIHMRRNRRWQPGFFGRARPTG